MRCSIAFLFCLCGGQAFGQATAADSVSIPKWLYGGNVALVRSNWISDEVSVNDASRLGIEGGLTVIKPVSPNFWVGLGMEANTRRGTHVIDGISVQVYESFAQLPVTAWWHRPLVQRQENPLRAVHSLLGGGVYAAWLLDQGFATGTQSTYVMEDREFDYTKYGVLVDYSLLWLPNRPGVWAGHRVGLRAHADLNGLTSSRNGVRTFAKYAGIGLQYSLLLTKH